MKKLFSFLLVAVVYMGAFALPIAATAVNLCPVNAGVNIPGCGANSTKSPEQIVTTIIGILLFVAFVIALIFLIWGGIKWIMSGGEKDGASKAKETITSALIGLAVVLGAWLLLNIVVKTLTGNDLGQLNLPTF